MDVGAIFTTFDESEGARTNNTISSGKHGDGKRELRAERQTNDSVEASYITFMTPIFIFIYQNLHFGLLLSISADVFI